jgi:hypothetical protein
MLGDFIKLTKENMFHLNSFRSYNVLDFDEKKNGKEKKNP